MAILYSHCDVEIRVVGEAAVSIGKSSTLFLF